MDDVDVEEAVEAAFGPLTLRSAWSVCEPWAATMGAEGDDE
jgi:hypothetical protein